MTYSLHAPSRGFSLLEVTIALSISGVILSALWQLTAVAGQQKEAAALSSQAMTVTAAARDYINGQNSTLLALPGLAALGNVVRVKMTDSDTGATATSVQGAGYLPQGFVNLNSYGQSYALFVRREDGGTLGVADAGDRLIGLLVTTGGTAVSDQMGTKIVGNIGAAGGFLYAAGNPVPPLAAATARGTAGGWEIDLTASGWAGIGATAHAGHIATLVNLIPAGSGGGSGGGGGAAAIDDLTDGKTNYAADLNLFMGSNAGDAIAAGGQNNTGVGIYALRALTTGDNNIALGRSALPLLTTGSNNIAIGATALNSETTGATNTAVGNASMYSANGSIENTAVGAFSLYYNSIGSYNTALGRSAMSSNTSGNYNTAVGWFALSSNGTAAANSNTAVGASAGFNTTTGSQNTVMGREALYSNTTGNQNTASGYQALYSNTTGGYNTAFGSLALRSNTTGDINTAMGYSAMYANTTGRWNTAIGNQALRNNTTGTYNTAIGNQTMVGTAIPGITGSYNTAIGANALRSTTTGSYNTAVGNEALMTTTTGCCNTAHGHQALRNNTIGIGNTAIGYFALLSNTTGGQNIALGYSALYSTNTGNGNIGIGAQALYANTSGESNTAINASALIGNTTGSRNIAVGNEALSQSTSGNDNVALGTRAGFGNTTGSLNTFVGAQAYANATSYTNSTALGAYAVITASNQVRIGDNNVTDIGGYAAWNNLSDRRVKHDIAPLDLGLDFVVRLQPKSYRMNNEPDGPLHFGFIAQDIAAVLGERKSALVFQEPGEDGMWRYTSADMIAPVVKSIQELKQLQESCLTAETAQQIIATEVEKALAALNAKH